MRSAVAFYVIACGCGGGHGAVSDSGSDDAAHDAAADAPADAPTCRALPFAAAGDASFAHDPSGRTWMTYSDVAAGPGDLRLVSTHLAYTDDGGATFCDGGVINAAAAIVTPPAELAGIATFWVHEVSTLIYDAEAPAAERWRLDWHRYLLANTGAAEERQFQYSWISEKRAAAPTALAAAAEHKLLAAGAYSAGYSDTVIGPPETRVDQLDPALADCLVLTEPGGLATIDARWLALSCGTADPTAARIILLADARAGAWRYAGRLLGRAEAQQINAALDGFSAAALFTSGGTTYLSASPTVGGIYKGCIGYAIALTAGTLASAPVFAVMGTTTFSGACGFDASLTATGLVLGQVDLTAVPPSFTLLATDVAP